MSILQSAQRRYATKVFDPSRTLSPEHIDALKQVLKLSPSSVNYQGWHFVCITSDEGKAKLSESCHGNFAYNAQKITNAAMVAVLCAKTEATAAHAQHVFDCEFKAGRFVDEATKNERAALVSGYIERLNQQGAGQASAWLDKQTYIALGQVLLAAADMGIDSIPIEGFDKELTDTNFALTEKGFHSCVIAAFGYRSDDDFNAGLPKFRLSDEELFTDC